MIDLTGQKFGRLEVKEFAGKNKWRGSLWSCVCDCGNLTIVEGNHLKNGATKSCGCLHNEQVAERNTIHGRAKRGSTSREYCSWGNMMGRCYNPNHNYYKDYGGRGIKVCPRWHKFENFYKDMGDCPEDLTLDRKDNNGDYEPSNCRWATNEEQANNRRDNHWIEYNGETKNVTQWAKHLGIHVSVLYSRLSRSWSDEKTLITPVRKRRQT